MMWRVLLDTDMLMAAILTLIYASHTSTFACYVSLRRTARRHSWEAAAFLGLAFAAVILFGWGLMGHLAIPRPLSGNLFDSLPRDDGWLLFARLLVLVTAVSSLPSVAAPARDTMADAFRVVFGKKKDKRRKRGKAWRLGWKRRVSGAIVWMAILAATLALVSPDRLADIAEVVGFTGGAILGFVIPGEERTWLFRTVCVTGLF
jgi:amino acid permease